MSARTASEHGSTRVGRRRWGRLAGLAASIGLVVGSPALIAATSQAAGAATKTPLPAAAYPTGQTITYAPGFNGYLQEEFHFSDHYLEWRRELPGGDWTAWTFVSETYWGYTYYGTGFNRSVTWAPGADGSTQELFIEIGGQVYAIFAIQTHWSGAIVVGGTTHETFEPSTGGAVTFAPGVGGAQQEVFAVAGYYTGTVAQFCATQGTPDAVTPDTDYSGEDCGLVYESTLNAAGVWSDWAPVGTRAFAATDHITYAPGSNGSTLELFVTTETLGGVYVTWQSAGTWAPWAEVAGSTSVDSPVTYAPGSEGSLQELFATTTESGTAIVTWENPTGTWSGWASLGSAGDAFHGEHRVTYAPGSNGSTQEIFVITYDEGNVFVSWETAGSWAPWAPMGGDDFDRWTWSSVTYAPGSNGSLQELFAESDDYTYGQSGYKVYVNWENPGGTWSGWIYDSTPYTEPLGE